MFIFDIKHFHLLLGSWLGFGEGGELRKDLMHPQLISNYVDQDGLELSLSSARVSGLTQADFGKGERGQGERQKSHTYTLPGP